MSADESVVVAVRVRPVNAREEADAATTGRRNPLVVAMRDGKSTTLIGDDDGAAGAGAGSGAMRRVASSSSRLLQDKHVKLRETRTFTFDHSMWSANSADKDFVGW